MQQLLQPMPFAGIVEHDPAEGGPIDRGQGVMACPIPAVRLMVLPVLATGPGAHTVAVAGQHGLGRGAAGGEGLPGIGIGIEHGQALRHQELANGALACGDAAGEADPALGSMPARLVQAFQGWFSGWFPFKPAPTQLLAEREGVCVQRVGAWG